MKCPICKYSKCRWVDPVSDAEKQATTYLQEIVNHNIGYIEMIFRNHQGGSNAEERMYSRLTPYTDIIERRSKIEACQKVAIYKITGEIVLLRPSVLATEIGFFAGDREFRYLACELGGIGNFEIIGEL